MVLSPSLFQLTNCDPTAGENLGIPKNHGGVDTNYQLKGMMASGRVACGVSSYPESNIIQTKRSTGAEASCRRHCVGANLCPPSLSSQGLLLNRDPSKIMFFRPACLSSNANICAETLITHTHGVRGERSSGCNAAGGTTRKGTKKPKQFVAYTLIHSVWPGRACRPCSSADARLRTSWATKIKRVQQYVPWRQV